MVIPVWLTLGVAALVLIFGAYRIRIAFRSDEEDERARARKGLYAMGRRTHFLIGLIYLLLGGALVATSFGWSPLGGLFAPQPEAPVKPPRSVTLPLPAPPPSKPSTEPTKPADSAQPAPAPTTPAEPAKPNESSK